MMVTSDPLSQQRSVKRTERHLLWLRSNLGKHSITVRVERELLILRAAVAVDAAVERALQNPRTAAKPTKPNRTKALNHKRKERA